MKNALNYVTYGICSAAVLSASFIGFAPHRGTHDSYARCARHSRRRRR